jgi:hypothetical protein
MLPRPREFWPQTEAEIAHAADGSSEANLTPVSGASPGTGADWSRLRASLVKTGRKRRFEGRLRVSLVQAGRKRRFEGRLRVSLVRAGRKRRFEGRCRV